MSMKTTHYFLDYLKWRGKNPMTKIIAAAIKINDLILIMEPPNRHHNIIHATVRTFERGEDRDVEYISDVQGFITDEGEFVDRETARKIVDENGQETIKRDYGRLNELFSEDLW